MGLIHLTSDFRQRDTSIVENREQSATDQTGKGMEKGSSRGRFESEPNKTPSIHRKTIIFPVILHDSHNLDRPGSNSYRS